MKNIYITICLLAFIFCLSAQSHELAITFDDLPSAQDYPLEQQQEINASILSTLKKYQAPAIGFVNEGKLYQSGNTPQKIDMLRQWVKAGYPLGNHTYSHVSLHATPLLTYEKDVLKGSLVSKKLMNEAHLKYVYFRNPYLHTGTTPEIRSQFEAFLKKNGYISAPVTLDTDDYLFNNLLLKNPKNKDAIIKAYLAHTRLKFAFYQKATDTIFGRDIKQIWLLHVNLLNAYALDDLLSIAKEYGYAFISLDEALKDPAYATKNEYYENHGVSWLYRWDYSGNKAVDWSKEPEPDL